VDTRKRKFLIAATSVVGGSQLQGGRSAGDEHDAQRACQSSSAPVEVDISKVDQACC